MPTSLSFLPVKGAFGDVLARVFDYLHEEHEPYPKMPDKVLLLVVDPKQHRAIHSRFLDLTAPIGQPPQGTEHWRSLSVEVWFGSGHAATVAVRVRDAGPEETFVELWLSSRAHDAVYALDESGRHIDEASKADVVRLCIGVAKAIGSAGFGYQLSREASVFGPRSIDVLRTYVEGEIRAHVEEEQMLILAGLSVSEVDEVNFVYDVDPPAVHYRQDGYYLYDMLWPVNAFD